MLGDSITKFRKNHNCLAIAMTTGIIELGYFLNNTISKNNHSLKNLWLWCNTTKFKSGILKGG